MIHDFEGLAEDILSAHLPESLFGVKQVILPPEDLSSYLLAEYESRKNILLQYQDDIELHEQASEALNQLETLYQEGLRKIQRGHYGMEGWNELPLRSNKSFTCGSNTYTVGEKLLSVDEVDLYRGSLSHEGSYQGLVDIQIAKTSDDNPGIQNELRALDSLHRNPVPQWKHLPFILDRFETSGRKGIVFRHLYGHPLSWVRSRRAQKNGIDQRHIVWMLDRALSALGYVHRSGFVKGEINPYTLVIDDRLHNVILKDWSVSVYAPARTDEQMLCKDCIDIYRAPEIMQAGEIGPWSDIYALGKSMIWALGGDPVSNEMPTSVHEKIRNFLTVMVEEDPKKRPSDCWELHKEENQIKDSLWTRQFRHLDIS